MAKKEKTPRIFDYEDKEEITEEQLSKRAKQVMKNIQMKKIAYERWGLNIYKCNYSRRYDNVIASEKDKEMINSLEARELIVYNEAKKEFEVCEISETK
jgi:hypothetical protein